MDDDQVKDHFRRQAGDIDRAAGEQSPNSHY